MKQKNNKAPKPSKPLLDEVAGRNGSLSTNAGFSVKPEMQRAIEAKGGYNLIADIIVDDQFIACFKQRAYGAVATEWDIISDEKSANEALLQQLQNLNFDNICMQMWLSAWRYGYAVAEILWGLDGNHIIIDNIKVRNPLSFTFGKDGLLRLKTQGDPDGILLPINKFWVMRHEQINSDDVYGKSLALQCYWPVYFKTNGIKAWMAYLEKTANPAVIGKYQAGTADDKAIDNFLDELERLANSGIAAIPDGAAVEFHQTHKGTTADYAVLTAMMNGAIAKVILGQTMTTDDGASNSQSTTHMQVRREFTAHDIDTLSGSFNDMVLKPLNMWNGTDVTYFRKFNDKEQIENTQAHYANIATQMINAGFEPSQEWVDAHIGTGFAKNVQSTPLSHHKEAQFAENANNDIATQLATQVSAVIDEPLSTIIDDIRRIIEGAETLEDIAPLLLEAFSSLDIEDLGNILGSAMMVADLNGRNDRQADNG